MTRAAELRKRSVSSADRLEASFRSCGHVVFSPQLRGAICSYVDAMKAEGVLVERVIVGMKRIASRGCLRTNGYGEQTSIFENDVEMQRAVSLCVARYHVVSGVAS
jgi:hypothetical protein